MTHRTSMLAVPLLLIAATSPASAGRLTLIAGGGTGDDGTPAARAKLVAPFGIDFGDDGTVYLVEMERGERFRAIDSKGIIRTLAGTGVKGGSGDGGPGLTAAFNGMHSLAAGSGVVLLADTWNSRIRAYDPRTGSVTAFAGTGERGFAGDGGSAATAKFGNVYCLAFDAKKEKLYIADLDNRRIRAIDMKTGLVTTVAGNGTKGVPPDNSPAAESPLVDPRAVAVGPDGSVFILERSGHALRRVDAATGRIFTVAGTGKPGTSLGGGAADRAQLNGPKHLCVENRGDGYSVLIADTENHRVLRYMPAANGPGSVEVVAGTGRKGSSLGEGDPLKCELFQPHGVAVHPKTGDIYIADSGNNRILKIEK